MTSEYLQEANWLQDKIKRCKEQLNRVKDALIHNTRSVNLIYCSASNPFVIAALNYEKVSLEQEIRNLEKKFAEL